MVCNKIRWTENLVVFLLCNKQKIINGVRNLWQFCKHMNSIASMSNFLVCRRITSCICVTAYHHLTTYTTTLSNRYVGIAFVNSEYFRAPKHLWLATGVFCSVKYLKAYLYVNIKPPLRFLMQYAKLNAMYRWS